MSDDLRDESRSFFRQAWDDAGEFLDGTGRHPGREDWSALSVRCQIATAFADIQLKMLAERNGVQTAGKVMVEVARRGLLPGVPRTGR